MVKKTISDQSTTDMLEALTQIDLQPTPTNDSPHDKHFTESLFVQR